MIIKYDQYVYHILLEVIQLYYLEDIQVLQIVILNELVYG